MIPIADIWTMVYWCLGINLAASAILLTFMVKYPKYIIYAFHRFIAIKNGMSRKKLHLSSSFSFSYLERGKPLHESPSVLIIHGFSSTKEVYIESIKHLPQRLHIITVDLPGHGQTSVKEKEEISVMSFVSYVKQFVDKVGLNKQKFHIVGASLGGHIAGVYAATYPDDLISVSLFCPHGIGFAKEAEMKEEAERTGRFILLPESNDEFREMIDFLTYRKIDIPGVFVSGTMQIRNEKNWYYRKVAEALIEPASTHLLERNLHKIQTPLLLVWGKEDQILEVGCVETIEKNLPVPPKKTVILDKVGHCIHMERPRKSAYILLEFLNTVTS